MKDTYNISGHRVHASQVATQSQFLHLSKSGKHHGYDATCAVFSQICQPHAVWLRLGSLHVATPVFPHWVNHESGSKQKMRWLSQDLLRCIADLHLQWSTGVGPKKEHYLSARVPYAGSSKYQCKRPHAQASLDSRSCTATVLREEIDRISCWLICNLRRASSKVSIRDLTLCRHLQLLPLHKLPTSAPTV